MRRPWILVVLIEGLTITVLLLLLGFSANRQGSEPGEGHAQELEGPPAPRAIQGSSPSLNPSPFPATGRTELGPSSPRDSLGILVHGSVSEADGTPVTVGSTSFTSEATPRSVFGGSVERPGAYAITGLEPGDWVLEYRGEGYQELHLPVVIPTGVRTHRLDVVVHKAVLLQVRFLTPEGASIHELMAARAREQGGPNPTLYALATPSPPPGHFPAYLRREIPGFGTWSARGRSDADLLPGYDGMLQLPLDPPAYVSAMFHHLVVATEPVQPGQDELTFHIPLEAMDGMLATIHLRVLDAQTRVPLQGADVNLSSRQGTQGAQRSDRNGMLRFDGVVPGISLLDARADEHEWLWTHVRIGPGEQDLGDLELSRARTLRGTVVDSDGNPVQATIRWDSLEHMDFPQPLIMNRISRADAEGKFSIERIGSGRHAVHASDRDKGSASALVDTGVSPLPELHLQLAPTHDLVLEKNFSPFEAYTVTISTPEGLPVWADRVGSTSASVIRLPAGEYKVEIHNDRALVRSQPLTVGAAPARIIVP